LGLGIPDLFSVRYFFRKAQWDRAPSNTRTSSWGRIQPDRAARGVHAHRFHFD